MNMSLILSSERNCKYSVLFAMIALIFATLAMLGVGSAHAQMGGGSDPCPAPKSAMQETSNSLARVQEEIDRFTLCVERAQLLNRLNNLVENNTETIDSVLLKPQELPPLPVDSALQQDFSNVPNSSGGTANAPAPINEASLVGGGLASPEPSVDADGNRLFPDGMEEDVGPVWLIREIYGSSGQLQARLVNSQGVLATVRQGDMLKDDSRIVEISATTIKIKQEDEIVDLNWVNDDQGGEE